MEKPKTSRKRKRDKYDRAMKRALAREPFLNSDGKYLSRDEVRQRRRIQENK